MFIRKKTKKDQKTKKEYFSYQLVDSFRTPNGPRQRILLTIGHHAALSDEERKLLANRIEELVSGFNQLCVPYPDHVESLATIFSKQLLNKNFKKQETDDDNEDFEKIDLNSVAHSECRTVGLEHICLETMRKLKIGHMLEKLGFTQAEMEVAFGTIIGRLVSPRSERATHFWLQKNTALDEIMGADFSKLPLKQLYKISDKLLKNKIEIESCLAGAEDELFSLDNAIALYDLTNTYLEGKGNDSTKAKRGRSKEKRFDCPLISLGLVLNQDGFPRRSHIYEGNISEPSTLEDAMNELQQSERAQPPVVIMDAGIASEKNLEWLREKKLPYIVCSRKRSTFSKEILNSCDFIQETGNNIVKASLVKGDDDTGEMELHCHSTAREEKETAIKTHHQTRFEEELEKLKQGLKKKGCTKRYDKVVEKIGRLKEKYSRVARFYEIDVQKSTDNTDASDISYSGNKELASVNYGGTYTLRVWGLDWDAEKLWKTYVMLTKVEEGFRSLKSELGMRPIFHRKEERIDGHLFLTLIAYHVLQTVLYQLNMEGINIRWQTLRDIMATHTRVTTTMRNDKGKGIHIRSSTVAEPEQKKIYRALGLSSRPGKRTKAII